MKILRLRQGLEPSVIKYSPIIWALGFSSFAYQLAAALALGRSGFKVRKLTLLQFLLIAYCVIYLVSISIAAVQGADLLRVLAGLYNLSVWMMGILIFSTAGTRAWGASRSSARTVLAVLFIAGLATYLTFAPQGSARWSSVLGYFLNAESLPENLAANTNLHLTSADWSTLGIGARLSLMAPYPTATGMLALMLLAFSAPDDTSKIALLRYAPYVFFCGTLALLSGSRAAMGALAIFLVLLLLFRVVHFFRSRLLKPFVIAAAAVAMLGGSMILGDRANSAWNSISQARADSSSLRFELYSKSFSSALEERPILGFGVKERGNAFSIPLGSHSTIVGSMYKTGLLGLSVMSAFFIAIIIVAIRTGFASPSPYRAALAAGSIAMIPLLIFEDIDSVPLVAYLFFLGLALMTTKDEVSQPLD